MGAGRSCGDPGALRPADSALPVPHPNPSGAGPGVHGGGPGLGASGAGREEGAARGGSFISSHFSQDRDLSGGFRAGTVASAPQRRGSRVLSPLEVKGQACGLVLG